MAYVAPGDAEPGTVVDVEIRDARVPAEVVAAAVLPEAQPDPMVVPTDLRYTNDHEWVRVEGDEATVGITAYAADQLGDIVFVELPDVGPVARAVRGVRRGRVGQGRQRPVRPGRRRGRSTTNGGLAASPELGQQRPVRRRLDGPDPARRRRPARATCSTPAAYDALIAAG